jgi:hypothetical protein
MKLKRRIQNMDKMTQVQYSLMVLFGASTVVAAAVPLQSDVNTVLVAVFFGLTAGLWISHLLDVLHDAAQDASLQ